MHYAVVPVIIYQLASPSTCLALICFFAQFTFSWLLRLSYSLSLSFRSSIFFLLLFFIKPCSCCGELRFAKKRFIPVLFFLFVPIVSSSLFPISSSYLFLLFLPLISHFPLLVHSLFYSYLLLILSLELRSSAQICGLYLLCYLRLRSFSDSYAATGASFMRTMNRFSMASSFSTTPVYSSSAIGSMAAPLKPWRRISIALRLALRPHLVPERMRKRVCRLRQLGVVHAESGAGNHRRPIKVRCPRIHGHGHQRHLV